MLYWVTVAMLIDAEDKVAARKYGEAVGRNNAFEWEVDEVVETVEDPLAEEGE